MRPESDALFVRSWHGISLQRRLAGFSLTLDTVLWTIERGRLAYFQGTDCRLLLAAPRFHSFEMIGVSLVRLLERTGKC